MLSSVSVCPLLVNNNQEISALIADLGLSCVACLDAEKRQLYFLHNSLITRLQLLSPFEPPHSSRSLLAYYHYRKHHKFNPNNDLYYEESGKLF